jgi:cyclophilin family peptidyl-prolyl cis-trans isomerase/HEAT repeat protein
MIGTRGRYPTAVGAAVALFAVVGLGGCGLRLDLPFLKRGQEPDSRAEALLLVMSNSLLYDGTGVAEILDTYPRSHAHLALTLGRVGDERAVPVLERLLVDHRPEVRRNAAFALGILGSPSGAPALAAATIVEDRETGLLAVEALSRIGEPFERWSGMLQTLPHDEWLVRLLPSLFRLPSDVIDDFAALEPVDLPADAGRWLVYAGARAGSRRALPLLREHLDDVDPWVRSWAARGLGRLGSEGDIEKLAPLLRDADGSPVIQALRAVARLVSEGRAVAPRAWSEDIQRLLTDPRTGVRMTAFEVVWAWLPERTLENTLARTLESGSRREIELALVAMARAGAAGADVYALRFALSAEPTLRSAAAEALTSLGLGEALRLLVRDPSPSVRLAAISGLLTMEEDRQEIVRYGLEDGDVAVRAAALEWLAETPIVPIEEIIAAMQGADSQRFPALAVNGVRALEARHSEALERGAVVAALEEFARDREFLVRRAAADALERLGRPRPAVGWIVTPLGLDVYRGMVERLRAERFVELETPRGSLTLELECGDAPLTCSSFMQLVNQGFYDGLRFHRVIPDFVVQGGDPRGDGWGGPGYTLRDEATRIDFERGVLGMARSDHHTAGSQFFITLSAQPHLDGEYTAFGRVVAGATVLDEIAEGDEITAMREVRPTPGWSLG